MSFVTSWPLLGSALPFFHPLFTTIILLIRWNCATPVYTLYPLFFSPIKFKLLLCRLSSFHSPQLSPIRTFSETRLTRSITNVPKYTRNATKWNLTFLFISIDYLSPRLIPSSQIPVAFCTDLPFFPPKSIPSFFPIELFRDLRLPREIDTDVMISPPGSLLKLCSLSLFLSLSSSPSSLVVSIFFIFSFLPFSNPPLIEAGGSISIRFQNSFISRSAITDDMDDAYRDPWKIKPRLTWKSSRFTVSSFLLDPFRILAI